jgi:hypothetical protein
VPIVLKSGSLNLLEPLGLFRPVKGLLYLLSDILLLLSALFIGTRRILRRFLQVSELPRPPGRFADLPKA